MTRKLLILIITSLVLHTINGEVDDDYLENDAAEKSPEAQAEPPEPEVSGSPLPPEESATIKASTEETTEKPTTPKATESTPQDVTPRDVTPQEVTTQEATTQSLPHTTVIDGQGYILVRAPNPFPNFFPPFPPHPLNPFMPMPYPMMFPPPHMMKPEVASSNPGSNVILLNQKNSGDGIVGQSTVYLKPDGNREIIIIK